MNDTTETIGVMVWALWIIAAVFSLLTFLGGGPGFLYGLFLGVALGATGVYAGARWAARKRAWFE